MLALWEAVKAATWNSRCAGMASLPKTRVTGRNFPAATRFAAISASVRWCADVQILIVCAPG